MVTVYDTDPVLAAAIANDIITIGDKVKNEIIHTNLMQIFYSIEREFKLKSNALDEMALKVNAATKSTIAEGAKIATLNTTDIIRQQANIQSYIKVYTEQQKNDLARLLQQYLNLMESYFLLQQNISGVYLMFEKKGSNAGFGFAIDDSMIDGRCSPVLRKQ